MEIKIHPNVFTYNIFFYTLCKEAKVEDAEDLLHTMIQHGDNPNTITYNAVMDGYYL